MSKELLDQFALYGKWGKAEQKQAADALKALEGYCKTVDQLRSIDSEACNKAWNEIEELRADLAEREAELTLLRDAIKLPTLVEMFQRFDELSTPPSTSYLQEWERERYGEPVTWAELNGMRVNLYSRKKDLNDQRNL